MVKTAIPVLHDGGLAAGDDLIAFGTGTEASGNVGVSYVFPSQTPTAGTQVPSTELYDSSDFVVGGRYIFLAGRDPSIEYQVAVFNATTGTTTTFTTEDIRLGSIPTTAEDPGNLQADGDYCAVICDTGAVTDGKALQLSWAFLRARARAPLPIVPDRLAAHLGRATIQRP